MLIATQNIRKQKKSKEKQNRGNIKGFYCNYK